MSPLKDAAPMKMSLVSVILDKSHASIGPYGLLEQFPFGDMSRHASTALLSSTLNCGKNLSCLLREEFGKMEIRSAKKMA